MGKNPSRRHDCRSPWHEYFELYQDQEARNSGRRDLQGVEGNERLGSANPSRDPSSESLPRVGRTVHGLNRQP